jgi:CxxC motif-containing protein
MEKEYICIACPIGCHLKLNVNEEEKLEVRGNKCKRGEIYAVEEFSEPKRVVTATCSIGLEQLERLPVKTTKAIPKDHISALLDEIYKLKLSPPVKRGQTVIENFQDTGVDVVAARSAG